MRRAIGFFFGTMMFAGAAVAQDAEPPQASAAIDGAGLQSCATYIAARDGKTPASIMFAGWIDGFMSGVNVSRDDTFDITPWQSSELVGQMVAKYCAANPEAGFGQAVSELGTALFAGRLATADTVIQVRRGEQGTLIYSAVIGSVNAALKEKGYDAPEGRAFTKQTGAALTAFQNRAGLAETGMPDQPTLVALFLNDD